MLQRHLLLNAIEGYKHSPGLQACGFTENTSKYPWKTRFTEASYVGIKLHWSGGTHDSTLTSELYLDRRNGALLVRLFTGYFSEF